MFKNGIKILKLQDRASIPAVLHSCVIVLLIAVAGCGHKTQQTYTPPPPPPIQSAPQKKTEPQHTGKPPAGKPLPQTTAPVASVPEAASDEDRKFIRTHKPIFTEEGYATWYTAAKGRHSANGDLFDDNTLTAAHRTLPMGTLILVTNLKTGQAAILRITDRGPFVEGRILDLTKAAARAVGTYREGLSHVRLDVYQTPKPIHSGGKWCVQIGAFKNEEARSSLRNS